MIRLETATERDIPTLRDLADRIWRECYAEIIPPAQIDYMLRWMYSENVIAKELREGVHWALVYEGELAIGYLSVTFGKDRVTKLNKLYLLPEYQGRGIGQQMLADVFERAARQGAREVRLQVNKANVRAQRAYERSGFQRIDTGVFDIGGGFVMDDFILSRPISPDSR